MDNTPSQGYIYLMKEREFIKTEENIYKIGKTNQKNFKRFSQYPKGSCLLYYQKVNDYNRVEKMIIRELRIKYKTLKDIGKEYFEGNVIDILLSIIEIAYAFTEGKMIDESKKELSEYYNKLEEKFVSKDELFNSLMKACSGENTKEEHEEMLHSGNREFLTSHKALCDIVLTSLLEEYLMVKHIVNTNQLKGANDDDKCIVLSRYNAYQYIIECIKGDPSRGDICVSEASREKMKIAGEFLHKSGGKQLMFNFVYNKIPQIFHREIDYIWDGIGDWKC